VEYPFGKPHAQNLETASSVSIRVVVYISSKIVTVL